MQEPEKNQATRITPSLLDQAPHQHADAPILAQLDGLPARRPIRRHWRPWAWTGALLLLATGILALSLFDRPDPPVQQVMAEPPPVLHAAPLPAPVLIEAPDVAPLPLPPVTVAAIPQPAPTVRPAPPRRPLVPVRKPVASDPDEALLAAIVRRTQTPPASTPKP
ncbi:hypothetical protein [Massilia sp. TS11]|uniref:hypothetical protein n=1 Tax=Massilia sp. TS11 TaxID=2908003 RepID=UPI001EDC6C12|nr:hypothetical protein [Massilia sp. TS11]MCG2584209.1 hypothetical protein [Massilia sp. TS11]